MSAWRPAVPPAFERTPLARRFWTQGRAADCPGLDGPGREKRTAGRPACRAKLRQRSAPFDAT